MKGWLRAYKQGDTQEANVFVPMVKPKEYEDATHIVHKPTGFACSLDDIGVTGQDHSWQFVDNDDDMKACLSNGKHLKVTLHPMFQKLDYYTKFEDCITHHFGDASWKESFGSEMAEARKAAKSEFADAKDKLVAAAKEAGVDVTTPTKSKAKRVRG